MKAKMDTEARAPLETAVADTHASGLAIPISIALSTMLAACGGGGGGDSPGTGSGPGTDPGPGPGTVITGPHTDAEAARFLQRAQFSSTTQEISDLRAVGYTQWLTNQITSPRSGITGWDWLEARGYGVVDSHQYFLQFYPIDYMIGNQLLSGPDMMRKRMALALSELFVASFVNTSFTWYSHAYADWWDMLMRNASGNFRQLLEDVTLHPAMGVFLNTRGNQKEDPATGRMPDENYAREVMQLFSLGVHELNLDGTPKTDGNGQPVDTYTQDDVTNLARVFTGWDLDLSDGQGFIDPVLNRYYWSKDFACKPMALNASRHSNLEATFLGVTVPANTPGLEALRIAMDTLFNHPNVGPFFSRQMIQRLVTGNPSPSYVARVASKFNDNGSGVRGDLRAVWAAILLDEEALGAQSLQSPTFGKLREPMVRFIQWARTFGVTSIAGSWKFRGGTLQTELAQGPLRAPSVFNFFRPGYVPPGTALSALGATSPEFQLINEITVCNYINVMAFYIRNGMNVADPNQTHLTLGSTNWVFDIVPDYQQELSLVTDATALVNHLSLVLCANQLSSANKQVMVTALEASPVTTASSEEIKLDRIAAAILMIMASAEYIVQK
ncbi:DUF1800 domain-containing protein [Hydrogenophaga sp.]|uniref:DUF1800 domain-containing protein n=1 Tax=Hydrogenophaga sp. TaxID=1904254 RepID=UPI003F6FC163